MIIVSKYFHATFLLLNLSLIKLCLSCGGGGSGSGNSNNNNKDVAEQIWDIIKWIPGDNSGLTEAFILSFLNDNLAKAFGGTLKASSYPGTGKGIITCPADLTCHEFDQNCRWRNTKQEDIQYYKGTGAPDPKKWEYYMGTSVYPQETFALLASNTGDHHGWFVSDPIPNQPGDGYLDFRFWMTPLVELTVCTRAPNADSFSYCSPTIRSFELPGPKSVLIPGPIRENFEIVIHAQHFITDPGGIVAIDDISYRSDLCGGGSGTSSTKSTTRSTTRGPRARELSREPQSTQETTTTTVSNEITQVDSNAVPPCEAVPCDFTAGACGYTLQSDAAIESFAVQRGKVGNPLTGITRDIRGSADFTEPYLLAHGSSDTSVPGTAIAASKPFLMNEPLRVKFYRHQGSTSTKLSVCVDNTSNCLKTYTDVIRRWKEETVNIPATGSSGRLLFVAEGLSSTTYTGIDKIELLNQQSNSVC